MIGPGRERSGSSMKAGFRWPTKFLPYRAWPCCPTSGAWRTRFEADRGDLREVAHELRGPGSTLGGARPKSDFEDADGALYVAKYTTERDRLPVERMEVATLRLAGEVGLRVAKGRLALDRTEYPVALIERFDRDGEQRLHYISAKTFLGFTSNETGCYADLADAMRSACGDGLRGELRELHRRLVFNILVSNDDDHLKNHGFLRVGESWRLSPAFDLNPNPDGSSRLQTGIVEPSDNAPSLEAAVEAAPLFELDADAAMADARRMAKIIAERWRPLCAEMGMDRGACDRYAKAFRRAGELGAEDSGPKRARMGKRPLARPLDPPSVPQRHTASNAMTTFYWVAQNAYERDYWFGAEKAGVVAARTEDFRDRIQSLRRSRKLPRAALEYAANRW